MKYEGWTEVWIPGKQRTLASTSGYKVIWLGNGDVLQQFPNQIKTYFYKGHKILKIQFKAEPAVYYHEEAGQLWRFLEANMRETVFMNGRREMTEDRNGNAI